MNVALVANLRTDAGGQYNQQRRNNVAAANHVIDLFQRNNRRRVRGLMNRVVGMVVLMEPTFSIDGGHHNHNEIREGRFVQIK